MHTSCPNCEEHVIVTDWNHAGCNEHHCPFCGVWVCYSCQHVYPEEMWEEPTMGRPVPDAPTDEDELQPISLIDDESIPEQPSTSEFTSSGPSLSPSDLTSDNEYRAWREARIRMRRRNNQSPPESKPQYPF